MNGWVVQTVFWEISVLPITKSTYCQYRGMDVYIFILYYYMKGNMTGSFSQDCKHELNNVDFTLKCRLLNSRFKVCLK